MTKNNVTDLLAYKTVRDEAGRAEALKEHLAHLTQNHEAALKAAAIKYRYHPSEYEIRRQRLTREFESMKEAYRLAFS